MARSSVGPPPPSIVRSTSRRLLWCHGRSPSTANAIVAWPPLDSTAFRLIGGLVVTVTLFDVTLSYVDWELSRMTTVKTPRYVIDEMNRIRAQGGSEAVIAVIEAKLREQIQTTNSELLWKRKSK